MTAFAPATAWSRLRKIPKHITSYTASAITDSEDPTQDLVVLVAMTSADLAKIQLESIALTGFDQERGSMILPPFETRLLTWLPSPSGYKKSVHFAFKHKTDVLVGLTQEQYDLWFEAITAA